MGRGVKLKSKCISLIRNLDTSEKCFLIIVLLVNLFYSNYILSPFATDTYAWYYRTGSFNASWTLCNGRFITAILVLFINWAHHRVMAYLIEMLFISLAFFISMKALAKAGNMNAWTCILALCPLFLNPLYCEMFPYHEAISMTLGLVFSSLSAYLLIDALNGRYSKKILISFLFLVLSSGCYQPVTEHFVVLCLIELITILVHTKGHKAQLRLEVAGICLMMAEFVLVGIFQVFLTKFMCVLMHEQQRVSHLSLRGIKFLFTDILPYLLATGQGTSPENLLLVVSCALFLILAVVSFRTKKELFIARVAVAICVVIIVLISPFLFAKYVLLQLCNFLHVCTKNHHITTTQFAHN